VLATLENEGQAPFASLVAAASDADGSPLLLLSDLARHTRNLAADSRVSLLLEDAAAIDPLAEARLSVNGRIHVLEDDSAARKRFLSRLPQAAHYAGFPDFRFYRIEVADGHQVSGFGRINSLPGADLIDQDVPAELMAGEESAVAHMNEDHAEACALYATRLLGAPEGAWRFDGFDANGCELSCEGEVLYLPFPERVTDGTSLRKTLVALAEQARQG
jgi:putative heme iron utilization protein